MTVSLLSRPVGGAHTWRFAKHTLAWRYFQGSQQEHFCSFAELRPSYLGLKKALTGAVLNFYTNFLSNIKPNHPHQCSEDLALGNFQMFPLRLRLLGT